MKIITFVLFLSLISTVALAEEITRELITDSYGVPLAYVYFNKNGKEIARQKLNSMFSPIELWGEFPEEIPDGIIKEYYDNGQLSKEIPVRGGRFNGVIKGYNENGSSKFEQSFKDGKAHGLTRTYREDGTLIADIYQENDRPHGWSKVYYRDGKLKAEEYIVNGICQSGKKYDENGQLVMEKAFEDGKYVLRYYKNGEVYKEDTCDQSQMITWVVSEY